MDVEATRDAELVTRLRRLEAGATARPAFDYDGLFERQAQKTTRRRRRIALARAAGVAVIIAAVGASLWRLEEPAGRALPAIAEEMPAPSPAVPEPRIVRADSWFAFAALEDQIASVDDALNYARLEAPRGPEVARLERTRDELLASYSQLRYAEMVSANF